jgi:hypothetical protein
MLLPMPPNPMNPIVIFDSFFNVFATRQSMPAGPETKKPSLLLNAAAEG